MKWLLTCKTWIYLSYLRCRNLRNRNYHIQGGVSMTSIAYIGMDVHTTNFTFCCYTVEEDKIFTTIQTRPEYTEITKYINRIRHQRGKDTRLSIRLWGWLSGLLVLPSIGIIWCGMCYSCAIHHACNSWSQGQDQPQGFGKDCRLRQKDRGIVPFVSVWR